MSIAEIKNFYNFPEEKEEDEPRDFRTDPDSGRDCKIDDAALRTFSFLLKATSYKA